MCIFLVGGGLREGKVKDNGERRNDQHSTVPALGRKRARQEQAEVGRSGLNKRRVSADTLEAETQLHL